MHLEIVRHYHEGVQTRGVGEIVDGSTVKFTFVTMELPWKDNQRRVSCIPEGEYIAKKHISPRFGQTLWINGVPGRSEILMHPANFYSDLLGCIAPGERFTDINSDGYMDVTNSKKTMKRILELCPDEIVLHISSC